MPTCSPIVGRGPSAGDDGPAASQRRWARFRFDPLKRQVPRLPYLGARRRDEHDPPDTTTIREVDGPVGHLTLDQPDKLNALSRATLEELTDAAAWFDTLTDVKVVVITGAGRSFCAGFDLTDPTWGELGPLEESAAVGRAMVEAIGGMSAVTIAGVHGHCVGGGVVLAAACDLRVAAKPALVLRTTLRQVEEATPAVPDADGGPRADVGVFAAAFADAECQATIASYVRSRDHG